MGYCYTEFLADGGPNGFPGGQCSADCSAGGAGYCGDGGTCVFFIYNTNDNLGQFIGGECNSNCTALADAGQEGCRPGYGCDPLGTGPTGAGFCRSRCDNPGNGCGGGVCNAQTGLCQ